MKPLTFGSLFAGIGGMDLGLERAGMECRWQVEIDPYCTKILERHWPHVPKFGDITKVEGSELERVDVIAGGFPCQDVSVAGLQRGIVDGTRSGLWSEYARIIGELRPRLVLIENVPGLLANQSMRRVLGDLSALGMDAQWDVFPASAIGTPHLRQRVWVIAYPKCSGFPADLLASRGAANQGTQGQASFWNNGWMHESSGFDGRWMDAAPEARIAAAAWEYAPCEPVLLGIPDGVSGRVDRVRACGNAVVPQVAEWIGRQIIAQCSEATA